MINFHRQHIRWNNIKTFLAPPVIHIPFWNMMIKEVIFSFKSKKLFGESSFFHLHSIFFYTANVAELASAPTFEPQRISVFFVVLSLAQNLY